MTTRPIGDSLVCRNWHYRLFVTIRSLGGIILLIQPPVGVRVWERGGRGTGGGKINREEYIYKYKMYQRDNIFIARRSRDIFVAWRGGGSLT